MKILLLLLFQTLIFGLLNIQGNFLNLNIILFN